MDIEKIIKLSSLDDEYIVTTLNKKQRGMSIQQGLKIAVDDEALNVLKNTPYIQDNFTLNIRKQDDMWSVYFTHKSDVPYVVIS